MRSTIAALARCDRNDIETALRARPPASRVYCLHRDQSDSSALQARHDRGAGHRLHRGRKYRWRAGTATTSDSPTERLTTEPAFARVIAAVIGAGATHRQHPRHRRLRTLPERLRQLIADTGAPCRRSQNAVRQRALPRRSRASPSPTAWRAIARGRAPGRVHDQRHRRARRQRLARGDRDGDAARAAIVSPLRHRHRHDRASTRRSQLLSTHDRRRRCSANKAIVGDNAFAHEAGIHQHGDASPIGDLRDHATRGRRRPRTTLVLGKLAAGTRCAERLTELGHRAR